MAKRRYAERISGPLLDRIDIRCTVSRPPLARMGTNSAESSASIAQRVLLARERARSRFLALGWRCNAQAAGRRLRSDFAPTEDGIALLLDAESGGLNPRGSDRVLRVAWTLADLAEVDRPGREQLAMALALRNQEAGS